MRSPLIVFGGLEEVKVPWVLHMLVDQGLQLEEASKVGWGHLVGPRKACWHHLQPVILTNQGAADDDDRSNQGGGNHGHRFPGDHKLYNF